MHVMIVVTFGSYMYPFSPRRAICKVSINGTRSRRFEISAHLDNFPTSRQLILQFRLESGQHHCISARLHVPLAAHNDLTRLGTSEYKLLLRGKRDQKDGHIVFEQFAGRDIDVFDV